MHFHYDPDEWETVTESRPCTACGGDLTRCNGACNGYASMYQRRRSPEEIARIKAKKKREHEDLVLAEAARIIAERGYEKERESSKKEEAS